MTTDDEHLRAAWQHLETRRRTADEPLLPLERIAELAASNADDDARAAQLDAVLAHPVMAAEYALLREVATARAAATRATRPRLPIWLAAAAGMVLVAGAAVLMPRAGEDPLRSGAASVQLVAPDEGAAGSTFRWRAQAGAVVYRFEVLDTDGNVLAEQETTDTTVALPASLPKTGVWRVTARLQDGQLIESPMRRVQPTP